MVVISWYREYKRLIFLYITPLPSSSSDRDEPYPYLSSYLSSSLSPDRETNSVQKTICTVFPAVQRGGRPYKFGVGREGAIKSTKEVVCNTMHLKF
jgi:hypothetical protein